MAYWAKLKFSGSNSLIRFFTPKALSISRIMETTSNESRMPSSMSSVLCAKSTPKQINYDL